MNDSQKTEVLSIAKLFSPNNGQAYLIPLYQRNYAWGKAEVSQLLNDVKDMAEQHAETPYYLGSLVVSQRTTEQQKVVYELIDGQQRFTTLTIILAAIKAVLSDGGGIGADKLKDAQISKELTTQIGTENKLAEKLVFEGRPESKRALEALFTKDSSARAKCGVATIKAAYQVVENFLKELPFQPATSSSPDKPALSLPDFVNYLLEHTKLLRTPVPEETDLNHYFEIMNNRGEQLEKHEILKAELMGKLQNSDSASDKSLSLTEEQVCFAQIWDACAEMDRYLVMSFKSKRRTLLFGDNLDSWPKDFTEFCSLLTKNIDEKTDSTLNVEDALKFSQEQSLQALIQKPKFHSKTKRQEKAYQGAFTGIINFPNFLLQVLRVWGGQESKLTDQPDKLCLDRDITLDDKKLLDAFESIKNAEQVRSFAHTLLVCRLLLDSYVIKRKSDENWTLKSIRKYASQSRSSDNYNDVSTFGTETAGETSGLNKQLEMILAMFHVSFPGQSRKHWLSAVLGYLYQQRQENTVELKGEVYLTFLEQLSDHLFFGHFYNQHRQDYDELLSDLSCSGNTVVAKHSTDSRGLIESHLNRGTDTENFIFNRLDYLLWKRLVKDSNDEIFAHCKENKVFSDKLNQFSFTARSSVEHYYPQQSKGQSFPSENGGVDRFGNLCLISQSLNSRLSNAGYEDKKRIFKNSSATESLKQLLMMSYKEWGPDSGDKHNSEHPNGMDNVDKHEEEMIKVLCSTSG